MADKIKCKMCDSDTGYETDTPVGLRVRSVVGGGGKDAKGELHFCETCWDKHDFATELGR